MNVSVPQTEELAERGKFHSMSRQMSNWVEQVLGTGYHQYRPGEVWTPAINLYEDETHYCVIVDLAGMLPDKIDLRIEESVMIIAGERVAPGLAEVHGTKRVHLMEIDHGQFIRRVHLPEDVNVEGIQQACYRNGYLWIHLNKRS